MSRHRLRRVFGSLALAVLAAGTPHDARACRLALSLAIDISGSINSGDYALQVSGLVAAFRDARVRAAILDGGAPMAMSVYEWSEPDHQVIIARWSLLARADAIDRLADSLAGHRRTRHGQKTAIGSALAFGRALLDRAPACARQVIDISGDGYNNRGPEPGLVYATSDFSRITVNALVVGGLDRPKLTDYFETQVIRGAGAFALATQDFTDYAEAIRRKLLREIRGPGGIAAATPW